jgi:glycosyltransferase involved in cell wall biosynthesis
MDISVCIPSFRRPQVLVGTLKEVLREKGSLELEVIVVDQTPKDELGDAFYAEIEALAAQMPLTYVWREQPNSNAARNHALQLAKADVVVYFDDDVLLSPGIFQNYLKSYERSAAGKEVIAVAGECYHRSLAQDLPYQELSTENPEHGTGRQFESLGTERRADLDNGILTGCNMSFLRSYAIEAGGFDEQLTSYFDEGDFSKRLENVFPGKAVIFDPVPFAVHLRAPMGGHRLTVANHGKRETDIVFSQLSYWLRHHPEISDWKHIYRHFRVGPLRKENVVNFWRQPACWLAFYRAVRLAYSKKDVIVSPFVKA